MWGTMYYSFQYHPHKLTFFWEETTQLLWMWTHQRFFVGSNPNGPLSRKLLARALRLLRFFLGPFRSGDSERNDSLDVTIFPTGLWIPFSPRATIQPIRFYQLQSVTFLIPQMSGDQHPGDLRSI